MISPMSQRKSLERKASRNGRVHWTALLAIVLALAAGSLAYAGIPSSSGSISGCYAKDGGALRLIDLSRGIRCSTATETAISWSQTGPRVPQGRQAPQARWWRRDDSHLRWRAGEHQSQRQLRQDPLEEARSRELGARCHRQHMARGEDLEDQPSAGESVRDVACQLRNGGTYVGGATDRRLIAYADTVKRSLSMNGGAQISARGGEVSVWCLAQYGRDGLDKVVYAQLMAIKLGGFS